MSKEVKRWDELKSLAEGMDGWPNQNAFECDDAWCVGAIDEDENLWPVIEIQTEQYDAFDAAEPMAKYYAAANPPAILELLAERDALLAERDRLRESLEELLDCPGNVVQATVPKAGIEAAPPYQVVLDVSVSLTRWKKARAALQGAQP